MKTEKNRKNEYPLSENQLGIYLECIDENSFSSYLIPISFDFSAKNINAEKLRSAFSKVCHTYSSFNTVIKTVNGEPVMALYGDELPELEIVSISEDEVNAKKDALLTPFTFEGSLLWRGAIFKTPESVILSLVFHHTIFDGTSIAVLNNALAIAYNGEELPSEDGTLFDARIRETELSQSELYKECENYFDEYFGAFENDSNIVPDKDRTGENLPGVCTYSVPISAEKIKRFAKDNGVTENSVFISAFAYTLKKFNNQNEAVFSSVESGRFGGRFDNSIGMFVKSFPLRFTFDETALSTDVVRLVKDNFFETLKHNKVKYSDLVKKYVGCSDIKYVYQGDILMGSPVNGEVPKINVLDTYEPVSNLDFMVYKEDSLFKLWIGYKDNAYTSGMIDAFADMFSTVLSEFLKEKRLCDFDLMSEKSNAFLESVNNTDFEYDRNLTVNKAIADTVKKYPDNIALSYKDNSFTYAALNSLAKKVGAYISSLGIGRDDFVSVLVPRNEFCVICAFGITEAGAAYQPLDPSYPEERLNFMVEDSKTRLLIADRNLVHLIKNFNGKILYTDEIETIPSADDFESKAESNNAFLLIYTSGTTGVPKGCVIENKNVVALYQNHRKCVELSEKSKVASIASFGFDAAAMDIFPTLMAGAEICIIPDEIKLDLAKVEEVYNQKQITNGFMTTQLGRMFLEQTKCKSLKHFILGGEKLVPFTPPAWINCHNYYGPSETIAYICGYDIKDNSIIQPIGTPSLNTKLYIVDSENRLLPTGCAGELCIAGAQVGREYLNRPDKTAEVFIKNPFYNNKNYEKIYKTGDIVRLLPSGNFDFIGRRDGQVKIRGFRIELSEIEQVIREFDGIKNATVQAFDDAEAGKFVAAFVVSDITVDIDALNEFIADRKPAYMVPAVTMQINEIPVNVNGKVDKRKLPKPERKFKEAVKPQNDTQQKIFELISTVVGTTQFGIDTDLFLVGLSSIGCIKLCKLLSDAFGVSVQMKDIRQNKTVCLLEEFFNNSSEKPDGANEIYADYPLTKTQEGIFVECISKPDSTFYNIPLLLKISKKIDLNKLKRAIVTVVEAHPFLKTELVFDSNGAVRQKRENLSDYSESEIEILHTDNYSDAVKPFKLTESRLFRFKIFCAESVYLFFEVHHIIADGTSIGLIIKQIEKAYFGEKIPEETYQSFDLALDEENKRKTSALEEAKTFYGNLLEGLDMNFLPGEDKLPASKKDSGKLVIKSKYASVESVKSYCENNKLSINGLLCSAFGFTLAKYACMDYSVFNTVYNGRNDSRVEETVGMLVKTLPVVCFADKESSLEIAKTVTDELLDSMSNDIYSFAEISKDFGVKNDIVFVYQGDNFAFDSFCGEKAEIIDVDLSESKAPLTLEVSVDNNEFRFVSEYSPDMYTEKLIYSLVSAFDKVIASFANNEKVSEISLLTKEIEKEMDSYNETELPYDESETISGLYYEQVKKNPQKTCVVYNGKSYTYGEAFDISSNISEYLSGKGITKGDIVSILINRDENMILCTHGVLMSGAAYLGLDPSYPKERLEFMLKDSNTKLLIADRSLAGLVDGYEGEILYTDEIQSLPKCSADFVKCLDSITPDNLAIVIYSSGTTGLPKGAMLTHGNIVCYYHNYVRDMEITENSRIALYASFGFDGSAQDILGGPMSGAAVYIIPSDIRLDLEKLERFYIQNKITSGFMTTQVGTMFIGNTKCKTLKHFMVGGEKFVPSAVSEDIVFYNGYGPSETMCYVNRYAETDLGNLQPIGKANSNVKEYIIDKFGHRLPFGAAGELCIASGQTGLGYLNLPEKTLASFINNPFCNKKPYDRIYKTGDIVRELPDGNYVFVGRRDGQVKIRGFRIELSEVEQIIREFEGVRNVAVQAFDSNSGGKYLAAYVVCDTELDIKALNEFIASKKPDYMIPAVTLQIDEIPLTANGKVDKKKLPKPTANPQKKGVEPANEIEEIICGVYEEVLGLEKVYADDDFFFIGGSSISAIQVVVKCNNAGYNIVFKNLFSNPTPHALSEFIQGSCKEEETFAPGEGENEYDCSSLKYNTVEFVDEITYTDIGDVLLTGVTGFLGSHILKELLDNTASKVICLVRSKDSMSAETRFRMMMTYYFEDWYNKELGKRVTIIDGELSDLDVLHRIKGLHYDTIINCAANVKHFAAGDQLLKDNFSGVENLISLAEETKALLVQISSLSVSGEAVEGKIDDDYLFRENQLNIGQSLENKYIYSKYQAEQAVIDAVSKGRIKGKIIRLGNLMARIDDSEFQINAGSSGFLKQFSGYRRLGMFPVNMMDKRIEFSPIDSTAKAVVLLSGTPDKFTVFHCYNCNSIHYGYFINAMKKEGIDIGIVSDRVFAQKYQNELENENSLDDFSALIAYKDNSNGSEKIMHQIDSDCSFTTKALYRLGFSWPLVSSAYLEKMVKTLIDLGFFS